MVLPNLEQLKRTRPEPPHAPAPIPSSVRSPRKPLAARAGLGQQPPNNQGMQSSSGNAEADAQPGAGSLEQVTQGSRETRSGGRTSAAVSRFNHVRTLAPPTLPDEPSASERAMALLDPFNQSGNQLRARDCEWSLPLFSLPGRAGLDLGLTLSYSSLVWTQVGNSIYFDEDAGSPSPGFRLGFPTIGEVFFDNQANVNARLLVTAAGRRVELRQVGTTNVYDAADSSYLQLIDNHTSNPPALLLRTADGTRIDCEQKANLWYATKVKERNGNYISITNKSNGDLDYLTDTVGRVIAFHYDSNDNLDYIWQNWSGVTHQWATFGWTTKTFYPNFGNLNVFGSYQNIPVLTQVGLPDGSGYNFGYNDVGQVRLITRDNPAGSPRSYTEFVYDNSTSDCPRLTQEKVWVQNWSDIDGIPHEVVTQYAIDADGGHRLTLPEGTVYKEYYGGAQPWQRGLLTTTKSFATVSAANSDSDQNHTWEKQTTTAYEQDGSSANYAMNPRATETNIYDRFGNQRRTTVTYWPLTSVPFALPQTVTEYGANGVTPIRFTQHFYNWDNAYLSRRIIGLPTADYVFDGGWQVAAKTTYSYDAGGDQMQAISGTPAQHESSYNTSLTTGRGNLTGVTRWDATDSENAGKSTVTATYGYDIAGSVVFTRDALNHQHSLTYADAFSDGTNRNSFAYPTVLTDADGYQTFLKYDFNHGLKTFVQTPEPNTTVNVAGPIQTFTYDEALRLTHVTNTFNSAYTHYYYGPNWSYSYSSVNNLANENYQAQIFDGAGRLIESASDLPGTTGNHFRAQWTGYDLMGRVVRQSNPVEVDANWTPAGDDQAGIYFTYQSYDWKGRPATTTNQDGTQRYIGYDGCGCAGGEVVMLTDEVGRQQKVYSDVLGRQWKTEVLNDNGSVYSTTTNTLNARDQVRRIRQYVGAAPAPEPETEGSGYQTTTMDYDGYGRLKTKNLPEQQVDPNNPSSTDHTTWVYKVDDSIESVTDARGASATYIYNNNRHLVNEVHYSAPSGITATSNVTLGYDAVGNRTSMTDGSGTMSYSYDQLSRITSETKSFTGLSGSYTLNYGYNFAGEVISIGLPFNSQEIDYSYDTAGRLSGVTGSGFNATYYTYPNPTTQSVPTFASNIQYRAWGARKSMTYGNGVSESTGFNTRLQPNSYNLNNTNYTNSTISPNVNYTSMSWTFDYYDDGRLQHAWDATNHWFDRGYSYDHAGRLSESSTYRRAEGLAANPSYPDPSHHTMGYDVWGNITNHSGGLYGEGPADSPTYSNNRRGGWSYDAEGNTTADASYGHTFDAGGKSTHAASGNLIEVNGQNQPVLDITEVYDGDGQPRSRVQTMYKQGLCCDENGNPGDPIQDTKNSYYVRSSVLGGAVIADVGQGDVNIYAGGERIAKATSTINVTFEHHNPATGSWVTSHGHSSYRTTNREERDAMGAELPLSTPYGGSSYVTSKFGELLFIDGSDPFDLRSGMEIDGMPVSASEFARRTEDGSVGAGLFSHGVQVGFADISSHNSSRNIAFDVFRVPNFAKEYRDQWDNPEFYQGTIWLDTPGVSDHAFNHATPQNPTAVGLANQTFASTTCQDFMRTALNNASTKANPVLEGGDIQKIFADFLAQKNGGISRDRLTKYGTATGRIGTNGKGNGTLNLPLYANPQPSQVWLDASGIVNELPHIAGSKGDTRITISMTITRLRRLCITANTMHPRRSLAIRILSPPV